MKYVYFVRIRITSKAELGDITDIVVLDKALLSHRDLIDLQDKWYNNWRKSNPILDITRLTIMDISLLHTIPEGAA